MTEDDNGSENENEDVFITEREKHSLGMKRMMTNE